MTHEDSAEIPPISQDFPTSGRLLGVDYGTVRIGLAICDVEQQVASPFENYTRSGKEADARKFRQWVTENQIVGLVLGLPLHLDGGESAKSKEVRKFGEWLVELTGLPLTYCDERFSSVWAEEKLLGADLSRKKRKKRLDKVAASLFLAAFLEQPKT